jgi:hypothetical protein
LFLLIGLLNKNSCQANFFRTDSGVYHLILQRQEAGPWEFNDLKQVLDAMSRYRPMPIPLRKV